MFAGIKYAELNSGELLDTETGVIFPRTVGDPNYDAFLVWEAAGNFPLLPMFDTDDKLLAMRRINNNVTSEYVNVDRALLKLIIRLATVLIQKGVLTKAEIGNAYVDKVEQLKAYLDNLEADEDILNG